MVLYLSQVFTAMKQTPDSSQDLFSLQFCSFTQVKDASHRWIKYQTIDHWNLVPHTSHLGSNSSTGRENMLATTTKVFPVLRFQRHNIQIMSRVDYCEKLSESSLQDSSDTSARTVLSELWRHFERRCYPSVDRTCYCVVHTGSCCGHTRTNTAPEIFLMHLLHDFSCLPSCTSKSTPAVLSHTPSLPRITTSLAVSANQTKTVYICVVPLTQGLQPLTKGCLSLQSLRLRRKISKFSGRSPKSPKYNTLKNWLRIHNCIPWCCKSGCLRPEHIWKE